MDMLSDVRGVPLPEGTFPSLWEHFTRSIDENPDNIALICAHQPPDLFGITSVPLGDEKYTRKPYLRWTYRSLKNGVDRLVDGLSKRGVTKGTTLFTFMPNIAEYVLAIWAAYRLGCVYVPINPRNLLNKEEVTHMIRTAEETNASGPAVMFAGSIEIAKQIEGLSLEESFQIVVVSTEAPSNGWLRFLDLMTASHELQEATISDGARHKSTDVIIMFTSGTTTLPKGCVWKFPYVSKIVSQRALLSPLKAQDNVCIVVPNNHGIGYLWLCFPFCAGATAVFPGPAFNPQATMDILCRERCTHTALVPTMIHALLGARSLDGGKLESLKSVFVGGTAVSPKVLKQCVEELGSTGVEVAYGMTEGVLCNSGHYDNINMLIKGDETSVGKAMAGSRIRVCAPNEKKPLPRGVAGELHFSGPSLVSGYLRKESDDFYIGDDGESWFVTGDQATIDQDSMICIVGRYKEMIIRGGENISPAAIESTIALVPKLASLNVQVVGASDPIAGEVPVAVVEGNLDSATAQEIRDVILTKMGAAFVPDEVLAIKTLGIQKHPQTMAGKIQKSKIKALVHKYREEKGSAMLNGASSDKGLEDTVKRIWSQAVGRDVDEDETLSNFADSITVMRARDRIAKETGRNISLSDMVDANTIAGQVMLIQNQPQTTEKRSNKRHRRKGPLVVEDLAHISNDADLFRSTKSHIEKTLSKYDLAWADVEAVVPAYDFGKTLAQTGIFDSWSFKFAFLPTNKSAGEVRHALESALTNNRILASFLLWNTEAFGSDVVLHVIAQHGRKYIEQCITDHGKVKTLAELKDIPLRYPYPEHATVPGPLFRALIVEVEETKSAAVIVKVHHAVVDASYGQLFFEDFDRALSGAQLDEHVDYQIWADTYFTLRTSFDAKTATEWHVQRLKDLHKHGKALFPETLPVGSKKSQETTADGLQTSFKAPGILTLRRTHSAITAPILLKSAVALLNVHRTGHTHALFSNLEAARTRFPFVPKALESLTGQGYEASDVAGPTIQTVTNFIEIRPEEKILAFLTRMQADQHNLTKYASAPLSEIISQLGAQAGPMVLETLQAQIFNWVPGMGATGTNPFAHLELLNAVVRPEIGLVFNAGMGGRQADTVFLHLRGVAFEQSQLEEIAGDLARITCWLTEHLDDEVGDFYKCLGLGAGQGG